MPNPTEKEAEKEAEKTAEKEAEVLTVKIGKNEIKNPSNKNVTKTPPKNNRLLLLKKGLKGYLIWVNNCYLLLIINYY